MAAVTGMVVAAAGIGLGVAQAVKQDKMQKAAKRAANAAANQLKELKQQNPYDTVGVPTMGTRLAQEGVDRSAMANVQALQGAGAEGVLGGIPALQSNINEAELGLAAQQDQLQFERDLRRAEGQRLVDQNNMEVQSDALKTELIGAQNAEAQAAANKNAAIQGALSSTASMLSSAGGVEKLDYKWGGKGNTSTNAKTTADQMPTGDKMQIKGKYGDYRDYKAGSNKMKKSELENPFIQNNSLSGLGYGG